jgi:hypothetical protein
MGPLFRPQEFISDSIVRFLFLKGVKTSNIAGIKVVLYGDDCTVRG